MFDKSPRPEKGAFYKLLKLFLGYFKPFFFSQTFSKFLYICVTAFNVAFIENNLNVIIAFKISQATAWDILKKALLITKFICILNGKMF